MEFFPKWTTRTVPVHFLQAAVIPTNSETAFFTDSIAGVVSKLSGTNCLDAHHEYAPLAKAILQ